MGLSYRKDLINMTNRMRKRRSMRRRRMRWLRCILAVFFCALIVGSAGRLYFTHLKHEQTKSESYSDDREGKEPADTKPSVSLEPVIDTADTEKWELILVNRDHPIPEGYQFQLLTLSNGEQVDERIYPQLQAMFDAAREAGLSLFVAAGYRTEEKQARLMEEKIRAYQEEGYSEEEARRQAEQWVAKPGTSEHQLGLAVDINANMELCSDDQVYDWLLQNSARFGFIKRYPEEKASITGIGNEPWHYRYVGEEAAVEMTEQGMCLEEYVSR